MPSKSFVKIEHAACTDIGMRRAVNQDSITVANGQSGPLGSEHFFMVADGMGAHAAGELASKIAVDTVPLSYFKNKQAMAPASLRQAVREANSKINTKGASDPEFHGMGTTCSCLVLSATGALVAHVGDSRVYRLRNNVLEQITFDHSLVWEMAEAINATESDVPGYIPKNVITRSLGPHPKVKVDLEGPHDLRQDDIYLLCSDGLCGVVSDQVIGAVLGSVETEDAAQTLVDLANLHGGPDNISVIVAKVVKFQPFDGENYKPPTRALSNFSLLGILVATACLAAFSWFVTEENDFGQLLSAAGCGAALAYSLFSNRSKETVDMSSSLGGPYGNGPYRNYDCKVPREAAEALHQLVEDLSAVNDIDKDAITIEMRANEEASVRPHQGATLKIDWGTYETRKQEADHCCTSEKYREAVGLYSHLIRDVMNEARGDSR